MRGTTTRNSTAWGRAILVPLLVGALIPTPPGFATCGGGGGGGLGGISGGDSAGGGGERPVYRVPWKVLKEGVPEGGLKLLWMPASAVEARSSELLESRYLTLAAGQCVGFGLLPPDNPIRTTLAPTGSTVVLAGRDGAELARFAADEGEAKPAPIEKLLKSELERREKELEGKLDDGAARAKAGDADAAAALWNDVFAERCLFSKLGKKAAKELKKLGRPVDDSAAENAGAAADDESTGLPNLDAQLGAAVEREIRAGLEAEGRLALDEARTRYENASRLDPADPVALRYLGEFHRHHSGDWDESKRIFRRILVLPADPVSRAVALHGLGKMSIHGGAFQEGLALIQASTEAWPLPLAYRNLAVYWFSEKKFDVAKGFMEQALALSPEDPYNRIFAAVYLVEMGRPEEARAIARENEQLLEASYNLAAVWAQLGEKEKAIELLARHFFEYERYEAVRVREMQEARDDFAFAGLFAEPAFVELTKGAETDPDSYHAGAGTR